MIRNERLQNIHCVRQYLQHCEVHYFSLYRLPLDDKLYQRHLQVALEMSMSDSQTEQDAANQSRTGNSDILLHSTPLPATGATLTKTGG